MSVVIRVHPLGGESVPASLGRRGRRSDSLDADVARDGHRGGSAGLSESSGGSGVCRGGRRRLLGSGGCGHLVDRGHNRSDGGNNRVGLGSLLGRSCENSRASDVGVGLGRYGRVGSCSGKRIGAEDRRHQDSPVAGAVAVQKVELRADDVLQKRPSTVLIVGARIDEDLDEGAGTALSGDCKQDRKESDRRVQALCTLLIALTRVGRVVGLVDSLVLADGSPVDGDWRGAVVDVLGVCGASLGGSVHQSLRVGDAPVIDWKAVISLVDHPSGLR